jgi:hypothetical protein
MKRFSIGQKWVMTDPVFVSFFGEVIEISHEGRSGIVVITDEQDNVVDTFTGKSGRFPSFWRVAIRLAAA